MTALSPAVQHAIGWQYADSCPCGLGIGAKLGIGFAGLAILTLALGGFALRGMAEMEGASSAVGNNFLPSLYGVSYIARNLALYRAQELRLLIASGDLNHIGDTDRFREADNALRRVRCGCQ